MAYFCSAAYKYALAFEHIARNPFAGLQKHTVKGLKSVDRRAFEPHEVTQIFSTPLFQGFEGDGKTGYRDIAGSTILKDAKYWLPILSLFHAGRLNEFAAMPLANFKKTDQGNYYFDLTKDVKVKNQTAERYLPLHPHMIALGFLDYVAKIHNSPWLFPELNHDSKHGEGHSFSKWWGSWSNKHGLTDPSITFHSWRHTWKRRARATEGLKEELHDIISGHKAPGGNVSAVGRSYGAGAEVDVLAGEMARIEFPEFPVLPK
jgi:integrase